MTVPDYDGTPKPMGSYPSSGIDVLIVGAGLAGLTAAIECTRKGHKVRVLERHDQISTMGDMYFMGLSGTRFFKHWPDMAREYDEISLHDCWMETFKHSGELMIPVLKAAERLKEAGLDPNTPPGAFQMRPLVCEWSLSEQRRRMRADVIGTQIKCSSTR
jgi:glycine/D-amino acid oxidase-like deaminating enzyme